jgi:Tfp pilus assembly protein PilF
VLDDDTPNERARVEMGITYIAAGDLDAAEAALAPLAAAGSTVPEVFYGLGEIRFVRGDFDAAERLYQQAAASDLTWLRPKLKLGLLALRQGNKAMAIQLFEDVIAAGPASPDAAEATGYLQEIKN